MAEVREYVEPIRLDFKCPECETGYLRPTGIVLSTFPPMYPHKCNNHDCTFGQTFNDIYPKIVFDKRISYVINEDEIAERLAAFINYNNKQARATLGDLPEVTKEDLIGYYQQIKKKIENGEENLIELDGQIQINFQV